MRGRGRRAAGCRPSRRHPTRSPRHPRAGRTPCRSRPLPRFGRVRRGSARRQPRVEHGDACERDEESRGGRAPAPSDLRRCGLGQRSGGAIAAQALDDELRRDEAHRQADPGQGRGPRVHEAVHALGDVARAEHGALVRACARGRGRSRATRADPPRSPRVRWSAGPRCARRDRGCRTTRDSCAMTASAAVSMRGSPSPSSPPWPSRGSAGTGTSTNRFSWPAGRDARVGRARLADVERGGIRDAAALARRCARSSRASRA